MLSAIRSNLVAALAVCVLTLPALGQGMTQGIMSPPANVRPPGLKNVGIEQHLNEQIPPALTFHDETGNAVQLGDYFGKKPMILNLVYYQCPMLCGEVLNGLESALRVLKFDVGKEFDVLTVSFDPKETPEMASAKKAEYLKRYGRPGAAAGWHFLSGPATSIGALTKAVGFQYQYDPKSGQFAHATAIMVLTPEGKIAQYYYGVEFAPKDLRLGLIQASENKIGTVVDQVLLYCYHYDPDTGKYGAIISRVLQLSAGATILILGAFLVVMFRMGPTTVARQRTMASSERPTTND
ncbi:MAG TPA: SCO family protein [Terriglobales bacterium]|nr:SCO family protein [Terriglobales bacterium]